MTLFVASNNTFKKVIKTLESDKIIDVKSNGNCKQFVITNVIVLDELFLFITILYLTPKEQNILPSHNFSLILKGTFASFEIFQPSPLTSTILDRILGTPDKALLMEKIEELFNTFLCVYIASYVSLEFLWPNTYIEDLGQNTHELDIIGKKDNGTIIIVETTRGFDKDIEQMTESYSWHFKKAIMKKWAIEKIFQVDCKLIYLSMAERPKVKTQGVWKSDLFSEKLELLEPKRLKVIEMGSHLKNILKINNISKTLNQYLISEIANFI